MQWIWHDLHVVPLSCTTYYLNSLTFLKDLLTKFQDIALV
jgi:hypothetical protein